MKPTVKENKIVLGVTRVGHSLYLLFRYRWDAAFYPLTNPNNRSISISFQLKINEYKTLGELKNQVM
jgi:hypothetical protein